MVGKLKWEPPKKRKKITVVSPKAPAAKAKPAKAKPGPKRSAIDESAGSTEQNAQKKKKVQLATPFPPLKRQSHALWFDQDPNAPKRAPSAYNLYCASIRAKLKEETPDLATTDIMRKAAELWNALSDDDKKVCVCSRGQRGVGRWTHPCVVLC